MVYWEVGIGIWNGIIVDDAWMMKGGNWLGDTTFSFYL